MKTKVNGLILGLLSFCLIEKTLCQQIEMDNKLSSKAKAENIRLPDNIHPIAYNIEMIPDLENGTIDGSESIEIVCSKDTDKIYLHLKRITVDEPSVSVKGLAGEELAVVGHKYDTTRDFYIITLDKNLQSGFNYILSLRFNSVLGDDLVGFYRGTYNDKETNETRWFAATQFEATYARRAFPCFDEPSMKAEFKVSLGRPENMTTISNMPLNKTVPMEGKSGYFMDHYENSVPMSTYLLAFIVSDFVYLTSDANLGNTSFRVWARKDLIKQAEYAKEIGPRILKHFEEYFKIDFPLPKQDMIALPDFKSGAMENWGLVTYRESAMLWDPKVSSLAAKKSVASVIAHELAHQWFGNLVTMKWWSQLWLNEGFASYVEYLGVEKVQPDMRILEEFPIEEIHEVFRLDALDSSHPISQEVKHPDDISQLFDSISYKKGASVIRMMSHFLTEATFRQGLANYLREWKYNNTIQDDLWKSLTTQAHIDGTLPTTTTVKEIMDSWTLQKGFPVVHVERSYDSNTAKFTQKKFKLKNVNDVEEVEDSSLWWTPISYASPTYNKDFSETKPVFWLNERSATKEIPAKANEWFLVNPQQTGYFRVNYDMTNWKLLQQQLLEDFKIIPTVNRAQILNDALSLAQATLLPYGDALAFTEYIRDDDESISWEAFRDSISFLRNRLRRTNMYGTYKSYVRSLVEKQYERVGFFEKPEDTLPQIEHRINVVGTACGVDFKECVDQAKQLFTSWMQNTSSENPIPKNVRQSAYCTVIRLGEEEEWEFLWSKYLETNTAHEKNVILAALGCTRESWLITKYLNMAMDASSGIRKQDSIRVFRALAANEVGCELVLTFLVDKWPSLHNYFGTAGLRSFGSVLTYLSKQFDSPFDLQKLEVFQQKHKDDLSGISMSLKQALERTASNIKWHEYNFATVTDFLVTKIRRV